MFIAQLKPTKIKADNAEEAYGLLLESILSGETILEFSEEEEEG